MSSLSAASYRLPSGSDGKQFYDKDKNLIVVPEAADNSDCQVLQSSIHYYTLKGIVLLFFGSDFPIKSKSFRFKFAFLPLNNSAVSSASGYPGKSHRQHVQEICLAR